MSEAQPSPVSAAVAAAQLAAQLEKSSVEYALGGALALGYWANPRGTLDVDITVFMPVDRPSECVWLLQDIGCEFAAADAANMLREHGFCRVTISGVRVDVFLPIAPFYEHARTRRKRVELNGQAVMIWDAETLAVFKMMFFRRKDLVDVEQILRTQGASFDRAWVRERLAEMYGARDPRLMQWDERVREIPVE